MELIETLGPKEKQLLEELRSYDEDDFETLAADLYKAKGWAVEQTTSSHDKGIDAIATKGDTTLAIQAKRYGPNSKVDRPEMEQYGSLRHKYDNIDKVVVITTNEFTKGAKVHGYETEMELYNGADLVEEIQDIDLLRQEGNISNTKSSVRPPEKVPKKHKTAIRGNLLGLTAGIIIYAGSMGVGFTTESTSLSNNALMLGFALAWFILPILMVMDIRTLRAHDANYRPGYIWPIGTFMSFGLAGVWYVIRRLLRTDIRDAYDI